MVCVAGSCGESYYILRTTLLSIWKFAKGHLDKPEGYWKKVIDDSKIERFGVTERNSSTGATHQLSITAVAVTWFRAALLPAGTGVACSHWQNYDVESGQRPIDQPSLCVLVECVFICKMSFDQRAGEVRRITVNRGDSCYQQRLRSHCTWPVS